MDFLTKAVLPFFRYRLKQIESHVMCADAVQQRQLSSLIESARNTEWGKNTIIKVSVHTKHFNSVYRYNNMMILSLM